MARLFDNASSQYLERTSAPVTAVPLTMACWGYFDDTTNLLGNTLMCLSSSVSNSQVFLLDMVGSVGWNLIRAYQLSSGTDLTSTTPANGVSANTWYHCAGVFSTATSCTAYINAVAGSAATGTGGTPASINRLSVGRIANFTGSPVNYMSGRIACAGVWNVALTAGELAELASGFVAPHCVRPDALLAEFRLIDADGDVDWWGQNNLTATNSPTYASHPPIIYPSGFHQVMLPPSIVVATRQQTLSLLGVGT